MGYLDTEGVLLRRRDLFEEDQEITLLTPREGCLTVRAPHAQGSQQTYCGRLEPPNRVRARLYRSKEQSMRILSSVEIETVFATLLHDDDRRYHLWPLLSLYRDLFPEGQSPGACYHRLTKALTMLKRGARPVLLVADRLLVTTAGTTGVAVNLGACQHCGSRQSPHWALDPNLGAVCAECPAAERISFPVSASVRELYETLRSEPWEQVRRGSVSPKDLAELEGLMYRLFHHHFEISLDSLEIRKQL